MKNGLILTAAVAALAGCASTAPDASSLKMVHPIAHSDKVELQPGQQALPEKQAMAKASEMKPLLVMTDGVDGAKAAYINGKQALGDGQLAKAQSSFEQARTLDPALVDAYVGLGVVFSLGSRHDRAVVAFSKAVSLEPSNANWHSNLGMAYARNGQFELAQQSLAKAWSLDPDNTRIEAQLTRVTTVAKANGQATQVAAPATKQAAPVVAASPLQKVGERMFNLNLGGSAPAVAADQPDASQSDSAAPLLAGAVEPTNVVHVNQYGQQVDAPAMPAIKTAKVASPVRAKAPKAKKATKSPVAVAPIAKAVVVGPNAVVSDTVITFDKDDAKRSVAALRDEPVRKMAKKAVVAKATPVKKAAPVATAIVKAPVAKKVVKKVAKAPVVVAKKKPVVVRSVRGMLIVASSPRIASQVSSHLARKGLRAERLGRPNKQLTPLTEIHYRVGHEADVAAVTKALPIRAYPVELGGLPAGVNIKVVVGNDMKRAKL